MPDLASESLNQLRHVVLPVGERLTNALAKRCRERKDLPHSWRTIAATDRSLLHPASEPHDPARVCPNFVPSLADPVTLFGRRAERVEDRLLRVAQHRVAAVSVIGGGCST